MVIIIIIITIIIIIYCYCHSYRYNFDLYYLPLPQGLSHSGKDNFLAALMCIPHGLRTMYVHAYQSYLWNAATSERCLKHGTKTVVQGDLVLPADSAEAEEEHYANGEQVLPLVQRQSVFCVQAACRLIRSCRRVLRQW